MTALKPESSANLSLRALGNLQITGPLTVMAAGEFSSAKALVEKVEPVLIFALPLIELKAGLKLQSSGFGSNAELKFVGSEDTRLAVTGDVRTEATGDESSAALLANMVRGVIDMKGSVRTIASGVGSNANFTLTDSLADSFAMGPAFHTIQGDLTAEAVGVRSISAVSMNFQNTMSFGVFGVSAVKAQGVQSNASLTLTSSGNVLGLSAMSLDATGMSSRAFTQIECTGLEIGADIVPSDGSAGLGNVPVIIRASGLDARSLAELNPTSVFTLSSSLRVEASGANASSQLSVNSRFVTFKEDIQVRAMASHSQASVDIDAANRLRFEKAVSLVADGAGSTASIDALELTAVILGSDLLMTASNVDAKAIANLSSALALMDVSGNVKLQATAERALSSATVAAGSADINVRGDVVALSSGNGSRTELRVDQAINPDSPNGSNPTRHITLSGNVLLAATGTGAVSDVSVRGDPTNGIDIAKNVDLRASGAAALARLSVSAAGAVDASATVPDAPTGNYVAVNGSVRLASMSSASMAEATFSAAQGAVTLGGLWLSASGTDSQAKLLATATDSLTLSNGGIEVAASGDNSISAVTLSSTAGPLTVNGSVMLLASGAGSKVGASVASPSGLSITQDVSAMALADGSEVNLTLTHGAGSTVSVGGQIRLASDSGSQSAAGAHVTASLALGKFGAAGVDLVMSAVQAADHTLASLTLAGSGGVVQIGGSGQQGTAGLTLIGDTPATGNKLVDLIDIDFTGTTGRADIQFDVDQDSLTGSALSVVKLSGFRLDADSLHFGTLSGLEFETGITSLSAFTNAALDHFNTSAQGTPVSGVFAAGSSSLNKTFIAYDIDGSGISAVIELDGVKLNDFVNHYQTSNGLG